MADLTKSPLACRDCRQHPSGICIDHLEEQPNCVVCRARFGKGRVRPAGTDRQGLVLCNLCVDERRAQHNAKPSRDPWPQAWATPSSES